MAARRRSRREYNDTYRRSRFGGCLGLFLLLGLVVGIGGLVLVHQQGEDTQLVRITIEEGQSFESIQQRLVDTGVVRSPIAFTAYAHLRSVPGKIQAGTYRLGKDLSVRDVTNALLVGPSKSEGRMTLIEGMTNQQIAETYAEFKERGGETQQNTQQYSIQFLQETENVEKYAQEFTFLQAIPEGRTLEGYLFPDTYQFFYTATPEDVIRKLLSTYDVRVTSEMRANMVREFGSVDDAMILASIVQKEAGRQQDLETIARVFRNRLDINYRLESDATVNYVTGKNDPTPSGADISVDSPYNTYEVVGLPVGPIGNPGLAAIASVIQPPDHDYFYFVADIDTGESFFAETFEQHTENIKEHVR